MYPQGQYGHQPSTVVYQTTAEPVVTNTTTTITTATVYKEKPLRPGVPEMPRPVAIVCCIINFILPGFGTICAAFSTCCCPKNKDIASDEQCGTCCLGFGIGIFQFCGILFLGLGWIWSCVWGVFFIERSYSSADRDETDRPLQNSVGVTTVVVNQPTAPPTNSTQTWGQQNTTGPQHLNPVYPPPAYPY